MEKLSSFRNKMEDFIYHLIIQKGKYFETKMDWTEFRRCKTETNTKHRLL